MVPVRVITEGLRPDSPDASKYPVLHSLFETIFSFKPEGRPTFEQIYNTLAKEEDLPSISNTSTTTTQDRYHALGTSSTDQGYDNVYN